jgi:hypothetical protein
MSGRFADESSDVQVKGSTLSHVNDSTEFEGHAASFVEPEGVAKDPGTRPEVMNDEHPTIESLLAEDGVDMSERPISQFCELCLKILRYINDETKARSSRKRKRSKFETSWTEIQHHENDANLKRSAANGCGLCAQFVQGLHENELLPSTLPIRPGIVSCSWLRRIKYWKLLLLPPAERISTSEVRISRAATTGEFDNFPKQL